MAKITDISMTEHQQIITDYLLDAMCYATGHQHARLTQHQISFRWMTLKCVNEHLS